MVGDGRLLEALLVQSLQSIKVSYTRLIVYLGGVMRPATLFYTSVALLAAFAISGCGSDRQLESISVTPSSVANVKAASQVTFTAAGQFNMSPMTANPARVSWRAVGPAIDPAGMNSYSLTDQPFTFTCPAPGMFTVTAYAPTDPNTAADGSVPSQVYQDLVTSHSMSAEGGFVAATAQVTCVP